MARKMIEICDRWKCTTSNAMAKFEGQAKVNVLEFGRDLKLDRFVNNFSNLIASQISKWECGLQCC